MTKRTFADSPTSPTTTLAAPLTAGDGSIALTADPGTEMPTTGPFSILVGDPPNTKPANCASRTGTTVTLESAWAGPTFSAGTNVNTGLAKIDAEAFLQIDDLAYPVDSVNAKTGAVVLTKSDVGLDQVDNTSDVNKPVSTAQAAADALKVSKSGDTMTGRLKMVAGSAADPANEYAEDGLGWYRIYAGGLAGASGGVARLLINSAGISVSGGVQTSGVILGGVDQIGSTLNVTLGATAGCLEVDTASCTINLPQLPAAVGTYSYQYLIFDPQRILTSLDVYAYSDGAAVCDTINEADVTQGAWDGGFTGDGPAGKFAHLTGAGSVWLLATASEASAVPLVGLRRWTLQKISDGSY